MNKQHKQRKTNGDSMGFMGESEFPVLISHNTSTDYDILLDEVLSGPSEMRFAVQSLMKAKPEDSITVHISSPGGCLNSGQTFLHAMTQCAAPVHMNASGQICSMAALILSAADSFTIDPFASVMFHSVSFSTGGAATDVVSYSVFSKERAESLMSFYTVGILSAEELHDIYEHKKEIWLTSEQFIERFKRKMEARKRVFSFIEEETGMDLEDVTPEMYVKLMTLELEQADTWEDDEPLEEQNLEDMSIEDLETLVEQVNELLMEKYEERDTLEKDTEEFVQDGLKMDEQY